MKKILNLEFWFHLLGFIGAIFGTVSLYPKGFSIYCWPLYCSIWIITSYINTLTIKRLENKK